MHHRYIINIFSMMVKVNKYETKYYASSTTEDIILELSSDMHNGLSKEESKVP